MLRTVPRRLGLLGAALLLVAIGLLTAVPAASALSSTVVISQVYGGGGNSGAPYRNDYVELFNRGTTTVSLNGWSVQYASATGTGNFSSNPVTPLSGSLAAGQYYLVQMSSGGSSGAPLPTPDATGSVSMSARGAKVVLVSSTTGLPCNGGSDPCTPAESALIVDLIGWGSANFYEGAPGPGTSNTTAALRNSGGCAETDNNAADFSAGAPNPRTTASPVNTRPTITTQPADQAVDDGQQATFSAAASGSPTPTVRWQESRDGGATWSDVPGATSTTLAFAASATQTGFRYRALFTAVCGIVITDAATLTVNAPPVVISQVYGGGGNAGATLKNDFIELFNRGTTTVSLDGWSVQYAATTGVTWFRTDLSGTIAPGHYYLIQEWQGAGGTTDLPTPDAIGTIAIHRSAGKVVLVTTQTTIATGTVCPSGAWAVDAVGYGTGTNCFEGSGPAPDLSNPTAALRAGGGCIDTDDNAADFSVGTPDPRNSASPPNSCTAPLVTAQPADQGVCVDTAVTFSAAASGSPTPTVRWQESRDGGATWSDVPGATSTTLAFTAAASQDGYRYQAVFTNALGTATSDSATLTLGTRPTISTQPTDQAVDDGQQTTFSAAASGSPTPTVRWQESRDGGATWSDVPGATSATLVFTAAVAQDGYRYRAVFTSLCGTATTDAATLSVAHVEIRPETLPDALKGVPYSERISAANGTAPYSFALTAGAVPVGLSLESGGRLLGTPEKVGAFRFTITATDADGRSSSQTYTLFVRRQEQPGGKGGGLASTGGGILLLMTGAAGLIGGGALLRRRS